MARKKKDRNTGGVSPFKLATDLVAAKNILDETEEEEISAPIIIRPAKQRSDDPPVPPKRYDGKIMSTDGKGVRRRPSDFASLCRNLAFDYGLDTLQDILTKKSAKDSDKLTAIKMIIDRGFGAAPKASDIEEEESEILDLRAVKVVGVSSNFNKDD